MRTCLSAGTHISHDAAGPDAVIVAHPALIVRVLPLGQDVLVTQVVGPLEQNPGAIVHTNGVAAADVGVELGTVSGALVKSTFEVTFFVKHDLEEDEECSEFTFSVLFEDKTEKVKPTTSFTKTSSYQVIRL